MECRYCQTGNAEDDHRCRRCGRRLRTMPVYTASAAAPALHYDLVAQSPDVEHGGQAAPPANARRAVNYQTSLFGSKELPRVVPFESIAPGVALPAVPRRSPSAPRTRHRRVSPGQQSLEFSPSRSGRPSEGVIYCDAPVALPLHRVTAAALDGGVILIAIAVFALIFHFAGGRIVLNTRTLPVILGVVSVLAVLYKFLWCLAGGDTPGMRWTRLKLVDFDGQAPESSRRLYRLASGWLSFLAAGMGIVWALVDEEALTWHDHISRSFPTPY